jgi:hypothetical protein
MEWKASREEKKLLVFKKSEAMEKKRDAVSVFGNFFGVGNLEGNLSHGHCT